ncbi:MAG TPA: sugar kinase [Bacillota bacterium]|jgi:2-dehydro-3-deoxygluconokinase|nr:sugar kinase [Bacillota bacterium]HOA36413.1 sugar kinase [Bacillota bacterium]HOJ85171.1 sugar kinase [Bacillota bacterium]HOL15625.1 sugar kinase [Bacillota bacterium]HPZ11469.1 sugar kinase [Bacillota bacterium]
MKKKAVTFGEIMLRLTPPNYLRLVQTDNLEVTYGGGEANVAVSLANYGIESYYVSKLPANPLGQSAANHLRRFGVNTDYILWGGERIGIYFSETGASQRPSLVIYDRANSAITGIKPGEVDWESVFRGKHWFHFTGITPALGDGPAAVTLDAVRCARDMGLTVSCDLNYRKKLWSTEKAGEVMSRLMEYVDLLIGNEEDAEKVFGIKAAGTDVTAGKLNDAGYQQVARQLYERFHLQKVAITLRESYSASDNGWSALLYDGKEFYKSRQYKVHIVDRVGGGDSFCGGLIYALLEEYPLQKAVEYAVAASCLKQTIPGDFNHVSVSEVENLAGGDESGRVQR